MKYSYGVPNNETRKPVFSWDFVEWTRCSAQCGPGTQESVAKCIERQTGLVDDAYCKDVAKPKEQIRPCELAPCIPRYYQYHISKWIILGITGWNCRWFIGDWQDCNKCPSGKRVRIVKCVRPTGEGEGEADVIADSECVGPKPKEKESCTCPTSAPHKESEPVRLNITKRLCNATSFGNETHPPGGTVSIYTYIYLT